MAPMKVVAACLLLSFACSSRRANDPCAHGTGAPVPLAPGPRHIQTVFVVVMENANWSHIRDNPRAPYLNGTLLPASAHAERYYNPPGVHPSEPNYLWMEGGTDYGIRDDANPAQHHLRFTDHLVTLLGKAGISWRSYQEDIGAQECPVVSHGLYAAKHNPFVFFDDVTGDQEFCVAHNGRWTILRAISRTTRWRATRSSRPTFATTCTVDPIARTTSWAQAMRGSPSGSRASSHRRHGSGAGRCSSPGTRVKAAATDRSA